jgi:hypothetical protein
LIAILFIAAVFLVRAWGAVSSAVLNEAGRSTRSSKRMNNKSLNNP